MRLVTIYIIYMFYKESKKNTLKPFRQNVRSSVRTFIHYSQFNVSGQASIESSYCSIIIKHNTNDHEYIIFQICLSNIRVSSDVHIFIVFNKFSRQKQNYCCSVNVREALISVVNEYVILEILIINGAVSQIKGESKVIC